MSKVAKLSQDPLEQENNMQLRICIKNQDLHTTSPTRSTGATLKRLLPKKVVSKEPWSTSMMTRCTLS